MTPLSIALAETILARFPDPDDIPWRRWCYVQGYYLIGLEKLWQYTRDPRYLAYIQKFADQHVGRDGSLSDFTGESLDDIMAGSALVAVYARTGDSRYRLAADKIRAAFDDYPRNSDGGFWHGKALPHEMWIDGVFMGLMFLVRYGAVIGDRTYCFDEAVRQITTIAEHCRKANSGLFLHGFDESRSAAWADPQTGLSPEIWSEGLGWYALILAETLDLMPTDYPGRAAVLSILVELIEGLTRTQDRAVGLWYQVVDKGERADNWHDTSGSAMFVYAIQRAVDAGYVDASTYGSVARKGYEGILTKARTGGDGLVDIYDACDGLCVQNSYVDYIQYPKQVNAKEAVGGVLWAAAIIEKPMPG